jgi:hypothetical protein
MSMPHLQLTILTPAMVFLGIEPGANASTEVGSTLPTVRIAGHIIAVTVMDAHGVVNVAGSNHDHERQLMQAAEHMNNTPMPSGVSVNKSGWSFSYANTVLGRAIDKHLPVVYTASMP